MNLMKSHCYILRFAWLHIVNLYKVAPCTLKKCEIFCLNLVIIIIYSNFVLDCDCDWSAALATSAIRHVLRHQRPTTFFNGPS